MADPSWGMREGAGKRMARVFTNETCNQGCSFCNSRSSQERREFIVATATRARIDAAAAEATTLVLTGGEPTMRRDLAQLVRHAKAALGGDGRVLLETNAVLVDHERAQELAAAGLDVARVHLPAWGDAADAVTRDPGGFVAARRGLRAFAEASVRLEVAAPVVKLNAAALPLLPGALAESGLPIDALLLGVPVRGPAPEAHLALDEAARVIEAVEASARIVDLPTRVDPHGFVPPCLFAFPARVAHLFSLTLGGRERSGYGQLAPCSDCVVSDRCPGLPEAATARANPIREERVRRRLSVISTVADQVTRELVQDEVRRLPGEAAQLTRTVRINFRCNQACDFCFVSTHLPTASEQRVRDTIVAAARDGAVVTLSGGEPTLNPNLLDYVRLARGEGATEVTVQTNATRIDERLAAGLRDAGADLLFVSLHGSNAALSDIVTGAPGTFDKTVAGLDAAHAAGLPLRVNFVFCEVNRHDFPTYVDFVARRWAGVGITVSFVAPSTDMVPRTKALIPRYSDIAEALGDGVRRAARHGVALSGFDSMCGMPLCLAPKEIGELLSLAEAPEGYDGGETIYADACDACSLRTRCFGLRQGYAALYGTDELAPV